MSAVIRMDDVKSFGETEAEDDVGDLLLGDYIGVRINMLEGTMTAVASFDDTDDAQAWVLENLEEEFAGEETTLGFIDRNDW